MKGVDVERSGMSGTTKVQALFDDEGSSAHNVHRLCAREGAEQEAVKARHTGVDEGVDPSGEDGVCMQAARQGHSHGRAATQGQTCQAQ